MDLVKDLKEFGKLTKFQESKNYYFDYHICPTSGENEKVMLDYTLKTDVADNILRFGICKKCNLCIYHKDFDSNSF